MARNNKPGRIIKSTAIVPTLKKASGIWTLDEAMQAHRDNAWPQPNLYQPVANSLRNSLGKTAYISRESPARSGSQRKFTFSWWLKKNSNATTSQQHLHYSYDGSRLFQIFFERGGSTNPDAICVYGGGTDVRFIPVLRDTSAWYHIVIAVDIDQSTSSNRIKCWLNGVQITDVGTQGGSPGTPSWPTSATNWPISQAGVYQRIGGSAGGGTLDGQFAEINFIDGYAVPPTFFGKYDTNNTWVPIAYTGSYGTNGFYLPFNNATTSQTLGYDASNTDTTDYDVDQDPYRGSVALHLTGNGPAGGNNNTFADSSSNNLAITRNGDVTQGSFSPFPMPANAPYNPAINGASAYFDGTGDYLSTPSTSNLSFGSGDFTIECWVYANTLGSYNAVFAQWPDNGGTTNNSYVLEAYSTNMVFYWASGSTLYGPATLGTIVTGQWTHYAICRSGNTLYPFKNGVLGTTTSITQTLNSPASAVTVGGQVAGGGGWNGFISNLRIVKGIAVYTAAFTPPRRPLGTRTNNLLTFSEDFTNTNFWITPAASVAATITSNSAIAPDGTPSASTVNYSVAGSTHPCFQNITFATANTSSCTASMYVKYSSGTTFALQNAFFNGAGVIQDGYGNITFANGVASVAASSANMTVSSTDVGNGWYRIKVTATNNSGGASTYSRVSIGQSGIVGSIYVWGAQLEVGSAATEYTPTPENYSTAPSLLLNFANAAVVDAAGANNLIASGSPTITSASKYGSGALAFNGSGDYWITPTTSTLVFGTDDFTVEGWFNNFVLNNMPLLSIGTYLTGLDIRFNETGANQFGLYINNVWVYGTFTTINQWRHFAITRQNTTVRIFIDGQQIATTSNNTNLTSNYAWIGKFTSGGVGGNTSFYGSMDDLRVTKGIARYTSDFTPPARALPETGGKSFVTRNINAGVVRSFTTTGTTSWTAPTDVTSVEVLVVAAGGAGGNNHAGGGGGGGLIYNNQYPVVPGQTYTVTVGAGGLASGTGANNNTNGGNSQFGALAAIGGGAGGNRNDTAGTSPGQNGGSGGGGGGAQAAQAGCHVAGLGTAGQGFSGGVAIDINGGGGGGAGGAGAAGSGTRVGGNGLQFGISGTPQYYAGGGGGSSGGAPTAAGGLGGGGTSGAGGGSNGTAGTANTGGGGGGGGAGNTTGSNGGSGIVVVRYTTTAVGNTSDATTDNLVDSPTLYGHDYGNGGEVVGNYATFNPLFSNGQTYTLSSGNLTVSNPSSWLAVLGTIAVSTGKWYFESYPADGVWHMTGVDQITRHTSHVGGNSSTKGVALVYDPSDTRGDISYNGGNSVYTGASTSFNAGDVIGVALDLDNNNIKFYKNNVLQYNLSNILQSGASYTFGVSLFSGGTISGNFGQRAWAYDAPAGFSALTTKNMPRLTGAAAAPQEHFKSVAYTAAGTVQAIDAGFTPDLVWIKGRDGYSTPNVMANNMYDTVRGGGISLSSDANNIEYNYATHPNGDLAMDFTATGFTTPPVVNNNINYSGANYVAWMWKAGGAAVSNTAGSITSQVSANTDAGFSIVTYTGNGGNGSVGHGLTSAPELIITKPRNQINDWYTYTTVIDGSTDYFLLNSTQLKGNSGLTVPSSTVFYNDGWAATHNIIAYCFHSVSGYSSIGSYTGNGSADGPFVYTGFRPAWVLIKRTDVDNNWLIFDTERDVYNVAGLELFANLSNDENNNKPEFDMLSNGFKCRWTYAGSNASNGTYIYMAFADKPFGNVNGTAR